MRGKMLLLVLLLMAGSSGSAALVNTGFNLLPNPGFEAGQYGFVSNEGPISGLLADGFFDNTEWAGDEVAIGYSLDTSPSGPRSGSRAQCVTVTKGFAQVTRWLELPAGKTFSLSLWVRAVASSASPEAAEAAMPVELWLRKMPADYDLWGTSGRVELRPSQGWVQLTVPAAQVPASEDGGAGTGEVGFMLWVGAPGSICIDDGALYEAIEDPGPDSFRLQNGDFEGGSYSFDSSPADISGTMAGGGWGDNTDWVSTASLRYRVATDQVQGGMQSLAIESLSDFAQFTQWRTVRVGQAYRIAIWARAVPAKKKARAAAAESNAEDGSATAAAALDASQAGAGAPVAAAAAGAAQAGAGGVSVSLSLTVMGEPYKIFASVSALVGASWTKLEAVAVIAWNFAGSGGSLLDVGFMIHTGGKGTVWLDTAELEMAQTLPAITVPALPKGAIPRSYFGMNINHMHEPGREYDWPAVDFGMFRTWGSGLFWPNIQPSGPDGWDWANTDKDFAQVRARQQRVMFTLGQTPTWASSEPSRLNVYGPGFGSVPANVEDWKRFVRELLKRYGSLIAALEVWNEPNSSGDNGFYNGTPEQLAVLALATQQVLRELKHKALLLNPSMAGMAADATSFLARYFAEAKRLRVVHSGLSWHSYNSPPELDLQSVATLRAVAARAGLPASLPVFNTETGILDGEFKLYDNSHAFGGGFLARTLLVNWAAGVQTLYWYAYDADTMEGLTTSTQEQPQPGSLNEAGRAWISTKDLLTGARLTSLLRSPAGVWTAALTRGSAASRAWLLWNGDQRLPSQQAAVPRGARSRLDLLTGAKTSLGTAQQVVVGDVPVVLLAA